VITAIVRLNEGGGDGHGDEPQAELNPARFATRTDYRAELIRLRRERLGRKLGAVLDALRSLSLDILAGGETLATVAVRGKARSVAESLSLPGVTAAQLDREVSVAPKPSASALSVPPKKR
jgi:hypothetical protein